MKRVIRVRSVRATDASQQNATRSAKKALDMAKSGVKETEKAIDEYSRFGGADKTVLKDLQAARGAFLSARLRLQVAIIAMR